MATILVTHGIPAEGFSLLSGEKIVIPNGGKAAPQTAG